MKNATQYKSKINLIMPAVVFGSLSGIFTALVVNVYKFTAGKVVHLSKQAYSVMRSAPLYIIAGIAVIAVAALLYKITLKRHPNVQGGGIPTAISLLRGMINFKPAVNLIYVFFMSLLSFLVGVPLGNEGPSVQIGTAVGSGIVGTFAKKHRAYSRYAMTGGACAGFSIATGAPISGMMFAVEEAHHRISPMIIMVSAISVMFANLTSKLLAPLLGVSASLFDIKGLKVLDIADYWIPLMLGIVLGIFAILFLKLYRVIRRFATGAFTKLPFYIRIFLILALTMGFGILSFDFISTGHELTLGLFEMNRDVWLLFALLVVRSLITLLATTNGITGGIFLPIISLGAVVASVIGTIAVKYCGLPAEYYTVILVLGICGCISGMMKMPLTAVFFAVEALACYDNILPVIIVAAAAYTITEIFGVESINDTVIKTRIESINEGKEPTVVDTHVVVAEGAFAVGKQVRDIFWPNNLLVLSIHRPEYDTSVMDEHGEKHIRPGDTLHVRYSTFDKEATEAELGAIVGKI